MQRYILILFIGLFFSQLAQSQEQVSFLYKNEKVSKVLTAIEKAYDIKFSYQDKVVQYQKVSLDLKNVTLETVLATIEVQTDLLFQKIDKRYYNVSKSKFILKPINNLPNIIITDYLTDGVNKKNDASFVIKPKRLGVLAGMTEADVFESLHQLPSVTNPNETATQISVRGGNSNQNNILFDGIPIYHKGHLFGMISAINPNIVNTITLYNKGTNPKYNERVSSVIKINTAETINKKSTFDMGLSGINFDFNTAIPLVKNKLQVQVSIRRSFSELYETPTFESYEKKVFQTTKINIAKAKIFHFTDYAFKVNYHPNAKNQFYLSTIFIDNNLDFTVNSTATTAFNDILTTRNYGISLKWNKKYKPSLWQSTTFSFSDYNLHYQHSNFDNAALLNIFKKRNQIYDTHFLTEIHKKINKKWKLTAGYQINIKNVSYSFVQKENQNTFVFDSHNSWMNTHQLFGNLQYDYRTYHADLGSAISYFSDLRKYKIAPRLLFNKQMAKHLKLQATAELKNQIISQIDETVLSDLTLNNEIWRLSDGNQFPIMSSSQFSLGGIFVKNDWTVDFDVYTKSIQGLTSLALGYLNSRNSNFNIGKQKNLGLEFYAKKHLNHWNFWMSYGLMKIKNKFKNINNDTYFRANQDIKYNGTLSIAYKKNRLETALAWFVHSGKPYTKTHYDAQNHLIFDAVNTAQLSMYHRLDFSATYTLNMRNKKINYGKIGISLRNIYNQKNAIGKAYINNNSLIQHVLEKTVYSIGFTPNVLFRVGF